MNTLALIRTHNSEWIIKSTIEALYPCVDGIIIHDDNSKDETISVCEGDNKVLDIIRDDKGFYHEGIDKSVLLNVGKKYNPQNFLVMDDDEILHYSTASMIKELTSKKLDAIYGFPLVYLWGDNNHVRVDEPWNEQLRSKLFPNLPETRFHYAKCHCSPICNLPLKFIQLPIWHYGYLGNDKLKEKYDFYVSLGEDVNGVSNEDLKNSWINPTLITIPECISLFKKKLWGAE